MVVQPSRAGRFQQLKLDQLAAHSCRAILRQLLGANSSCRSVRFFNALLHVSTCVEGTCWRRGTLTAGTAASAAFCITRYAIVAIRTAQLRQRRSRHVKTRLHCQLLAPPCLVFEAFAFERARHFALFSPFATAHSFRTDCMEQNGQLPKCHLSCSGDLVCHFRNSVLVQPFWCAWVVSAYNLMGCLQLWA